MKNLTCLGLSLIILISIQSCHPNRDKNYSNTSTADVGGVALIRNGIEGGLTEIKASGLAITNSSNQRVIAFAKMMIDDHTKAGEELKKLKDDNSVMGEDTISGEHQRMISELSKETGAAFDKAYMQMMVEDHDHAVELFKDAGTNVNPGIHAFAGKTLPTIEMHLDSAKAILVSLK